MRKVCLLVVVLGALALAATVSAHAPLTGTACTATKFERQYSLHVHGMTCGAAVQALTKGSSKFTCKPVGETSKPPFTEKCFKTKHKSTYYEFLASGG